jgi:type I restriction enzyme S subunit
MAVKRGYKQTEVGVIPEDWDVLPLHVLAEKIMVGIASAATHAYRDRGIVMFRNQNIKPGYLDDSDILYIDPSYEAIFKNKRLKAGDLLTARTGYPGTTAIVSAQYEGAQSFTTLITRPNTFLVDSRYLCCFINSSAGQYYFEQNQIGGGQKNVNAGSLKYLPVPLPPTRAEQQAIAEALSDVDGLISALDALIAKQRAIKQGAMQELLTGQRRLPGFAGEWEVKALRQVANFINGRAYNIAEWEKSGTPVIRLQNLTGGDEFYYSTLKLPSDQYCVDGDLLYMWSATFGPHIWRGEKAIFHYHIWKIECQQEQLDKTFFFYKLDELTLNLKQRSSNGGTMLHVTKESMEATKTSLPPLTEQTAIAQILADMDDAIAALVQKRAKTVALKQGMMQALLTGQVRLV